MESPHFLQFFETKKKVSYLLLFVCSLVLGVAWVLVFSMVPEYAVGTGLLVLLGICVFHIEWGIYAIALTAFFHGWEIDFSNYHWARNIPFLANINAPLVDFIALFFFVSACMALLYRVLLLRSRHIKRLFPFGYWYGSFLLLALWSAWHAYDHNIAESLKYFFRPMVFVYCMYAVLPLLLIQKRDILLRLTRVFAWLGAGIAVFGAIGFWQSAVGGGWPRVTPFALFGIAPLGYNHNMIAEVLVALLPFAFFQAYMAKDVIEKKWFTGVGLCTAFVCVLTLSRAAWIALGIDLVLILLLFQKSFLAMCIEKSKSVAIIGGTILVGVLLYMALFLGSEIVTSSNMARIVTTDVAVSYTLRAPLIGNGPGMFIPLLADTWLYTYDFGEALDAHGMLLKLGVETGIVGILFMGIFLLQVLVTVYRRIKKSRDVLLLTLLVSASGAIVFQLFNTSYFNSHMWFPIGLALAGYQLSRYGDRYLIA